ncbi:MAG: sulfotransferase [Myxococcales bacterium]|nr:sulfotransferase [Myxococcales bacterium]MCB9520240.1 sulfotransferase [Myxococcales bacterium]MCB9531392.1 sulfotransferase [Myxococcales bacterium]MCB9533535.1 sulfotransferase [Myxococcales bacterium]
MFFDRDTFLKTLSLLFRPETFSLRRLVVVLGFMFATMLINVVVWVFQRLDDVLYPRHRETVVEAPVFVIANPRSGTTFLHRLMCLDEERFTYMRTWQTVLPAVSMYRLIGTIERVDRAIGRPLGRLIRLSERAMFKGWDGVHAVGWSAAEEEEFIFISSLLSPDAWMVLPFPREFREVDFLDRLPDAKRLRVMAHFKDCVRRHVFATGNNRVYLSKNVFVAGRLKSYCETFPDARYVHLVRHPYSSLASTISMFTAPWSMHSPEIPRDSEDFRYWAELGTDYYQYVFDNAEALAPGRFITYTYDQLIGDPRGTVRDIYARLGIELSEAFDERLRREAAMARHYTSSHDYSMHEYGITEEWVYSRIPAVFERYGFAKYPGHDGEGGGVDAAQSTAVAPRREAPEPMGAVAGEPA